MTTALKKLIIFLIALMAIFLFRPRYVFAQVVINEIEPYAEWVELYKIQEGEVLLEGCIIYFHNSTTTYQKKEFGPEDRFSEQDFFKKIDTDNAWLNNNGDTVILDCDWGQNILSYGQEEEAMVNKPPSDKSVGRYPDGSSNLFVLDAPTPGNPNYYTQPIFSPTPSPTPSLTSKDLPTPTPSPEDLPTSIPSSKPVEVTGATLLGKVLGEGESTPGGFYPWEATEEGEDEETTEIQEDGLMFKSFLGLGGLFLFSAFIYFCYNLKRLPKRKE